jgi:integral membrane protein (TIGR01906 family)
MNNHPWPRIAQWLLVLALPIVLFVANIRIATGHWFVHWEYGKADFPPDPYGLSTAERTHLAEVCVDYLATSAPLSLLGDLRLPDGDRAFNARELRHMFDVQVVFDRLTLVGVACALILLVGMTALVAARYPRLRALAALVNGSLLTLGLMVAVGVYMVLGWDSFFTTFHRIFFEGESWIFDPSNTLIRLFPVRFWMDVALIIVGLLFAEAVSIGILGRVWMRRIESPVREPGLTQSH